MMVFTENEILNYTYSSQNTDYPFTNALNLEKRRKTWRTKGYWKVVSGENTIVFQETIATDLTATITAGEYTTDASFLSAIKTALDAAGASTYTVTRDTTSNKIKITSDGSGGGGVFRLQWTSATDFGDLIGFDTSANDTGALTYTADLLKIHSSEWARFDFGFPFNPTMFAAVVDRNSNLTISGNATIKIQASATDAWDTPAEEFTITHRDNILVYADAEGIATQGYRYWRFEIIDADNSNGYLEFGAIFCGDHITLSRGCPAFPLQSRFIDQSVVEYSESGQTLVAKKPKTQIHVLNWEKLTKGDLESLENHWNVKGQHTSFFICMDPDSAFSTDGLMWVRLVKFQQEPTAQLVSPNNWSFNWQLREEL